MEMANRRKRRAALSDGLVRGSVHFVGFERNRAVNNPDIVLSIHRYTDGLAENPLVRQRLRPERVDFEPRRLYTGGFDSGSLLEHGGPDAERGEESHKGDGDIDITLPFSLPPSRIPLPAPRSVRLPSL